MADQAVPFAYRAGDIVRHIGSEQTATIIRSRVKTIAPGKMEPMYLIKLEDGSELFATQKELVVTVGGAKNRK